ncbi:MAG: oligosaccharide flippase family protein [Planctomycetota bacterium]|nr:oligosaccharide flippase family protein [Planctomycetota bacterium]
MIEPANNTLGAPLEEDLTGQDRITTNILASWAAHIVFVIAGFITPRMMDSYVGQAALGIWDLGWSLVAYLGLVQGGIVSSVNRYVAGCRASGDWQGANVALSSVTCVLLVMGLIVGSLALAVALALPRLLGDRLGAYATDAQWVALLLGASAAVEITFSAFGSVLTGCYRYDLQNLILAGSHALKTVLMIGILVLGGGLPALALVVLCGVLLERIVQCAAAYRVYSTLSIRFAHARYSVALSMLNFGGKTFLFAVADVLLKQTTSVLIMAYLGPASLALYSRPCNLVYHVKSVVTKFAYVLIPTAGALHATGQQEQLRFLLVKATRYGTYITLPMVLMLAIMGGPLLRVWMGPDYEQSVTMAVLAAGYLAYLIQLPGWCVLIGMNAHGRPGAANLVAAICSIILAFFALAVLRWGLAGAALAAAVPLTAVNCAYVPVQVCRRVGMPVRQYVRETMRGPLLCSIPFALCLVASRLAFADTPLLSLGFATLSGGLALSFLYWRFVVPDSLKRRILRLLGRRLTERASGAGIT